MEEYNPDKETVQKYVHRRLDAAMEEEAEKWANSILYGDDRGGEPKGLLNG